METFVGWLYQIRGLAELIDKKPMYAGSDKESWDCWYHHVHHPDRTFQEMGKQMSPPWSPHYILGMLLRYTGRSTQSSQPLLLFYITDEEMKPVNIKTNHPEVITLESGAAYI